MDNPTKDLTASGDYVVVARRYRPQVFEELVGQSMVSRALKNAISTDRIGHAYLFTGARGVGKTSAARIFSKALNCAQGPTTDPCGKCDICLQITTGEDVDVLEIDGASNRGIDEIRQLRSNVGIRPSRSKFKVYIIDEVHMLTKEAFNALLKTLEEPPEHVKFIFCTTEPGKIPITVLSRCQRFDFSPVDAREISARLQFIVKSEGSEAEPEALELLARRAAGSMRDSQSLLEQLLSFVGQKITVDDVHAMFGTAKTDRVAAVLDALLERQADRALAELQATLNQGVDAGQLTEQLVLSLRDVLAATVGCEPNLLLFFSPNEIESLKSKGERWGIESLLAAIQIMDQTVTKMRQSMYTRVLLEVALVRVAKLEDLDELSNVISRINSGQPLNIESSKKNEVRDKKTNPPNTTANQPHDPRSAPVDEPTNTDNPETKTGEIESPMLTTTRISQPSSGTASAASQLPEKNEESASDLPRIELNDSNVHAIWQAALAQISDLTADFASHASRIAISGPNRLAAHFLNRYNASKSQCERADRRRKLESVIAQITGTDVQLEFVMIQEDLSHATPQPKISTQHIKRQIETHPLVKRATELFDGEVTKIDPPK